MKQCQCGRVVANYGDLCPECLFSSLKEQDNQKIDQMIKHISDGHYFSCAQGLLKEDAECTCEDKKKIEEAIVRKILEDKP